MVEGEDEKKLHEVAKELVELVKKHIGFPPTLFLPHLEGRNKVGGELEEPCQDSESISTMSLR